MISKTKKLLARQYADKKKHIWTVTKVDGKVITLSAPGQDDREVYVSTLRCHYRWIQQDEVKEYASDIEAETAARNMVKEAERKEKERKYNSNYVAYARAVKQNDVMSRISKDCYTDITDYLHKQFDDILGRIAISSLAKTLVEKVLNGLVSDGEKNTKEK